MENYQKWNDEPSFPESRQYDRPYWQENPQKNIRTHAGQCGVEN